MPSVAAVEQGIDTARIAEIKASFSFVSSNNSSDIPSDIPLLNNSSELFVIGSGPLVRQAHWPKRFSTPEGGRFEAMDQLKKLGAPRDLRNTLFTRNGEFRYKDSSGKDLFIMEPDEAFDHVISVYEPVFEAIEYFLDEPNADTRPYNDHGPKHPRRTYNRTIDFLRESGHIGKPDRFRRRKFLYPSDITPDQIARRAAVANAIHDGGYFTNPEKHPEHSIVLAEAVVPQVIDRPEEWNGVARGVLLHEGDNLRAELLRTGVTTHAEAIEFLAREYPYVPALIIADKIDQNRERVRSGKILDEKVIFTNPKNFIEDPHIETNLLTQINYAGWENDPHDARTNGPMTTFKVRIDYDQSVGKDEEENLKYFLIPRSSKPGSKVDVSPRTRDGYSRSENRIDYFDSLVERNLEIGTPRFLNIVIASFALNPDQGKAELVFRDAETGREIRQPFYRDTIDDDIEKFWSSYVPESAQKKRAVGELKI